MSSKTTHNEMTLLRKHAEHLASERRESMTTAHLLAAIAAKPGPASDLLLDWKLDVDTLRRIARASSEQSRDPVGTSLRRASTIAAEYGLRTPAPVHLLIAVLRDSRSAAYRALKQSGADPQRLRNAAVQVAKTKVRSRRVTPMLTAASLHHEATHHSPPPSGLSSSRSAVSSPPSSRPARTVGRKPAVPVPIMVAPQPKTEEKPTRTTKKKKATEKLDNASPTTTGTKPAARRQRRTSKRTKRPSSSVSLELPAKQYPTLHGFGVNLSAAAARGQLEPVIGREQQIERVLDTLARRRTNNPCLVGPLGVGKKSIVRGIAHQTASDAAVGAAPPRVIIELPLSEWFTSGQSRGALVERIDQACNEAHDGPVDVVLYVQDAEILFAQEASDVIAPLKSVLVAGKVPLITTATVSMARRVAEADPILARAFDWIDVDEPAAEEAVQIIDLQRTILEDHHKLSVTASSVVSSVEWSMRYLHEAALPEQAVSVLDLACARAKRRGATEVTEETVAEVVAHMAQIPVERLLETDKERMLNLESLLAERVVGHSRQLAQIATILKRNAAGIRGDRPVGSFLLLGPTGVGKTETAKAIAAALFHSPDAMTRVDMSEFSESHAVARLIGAPPGYVGHESGGQLTESVKRRPYQVLLLDEFEKAHRDVQQAFLQVLDEGRMTDGRGRTVDFTNTVIVLTSNIGASQASQISRTRNIGFGSVNTTTQRNTDVHSAVIEAARKQLPPELYNRIDEVLVFSPLSRSDVREVARRQLSALSKRLTDARQISVGWTEDGLDALLDNGGFDPSLGARPVKRAISRLVEAPVAEMVLRDEVHSGQTVLLSRAEDGTLALELLESREGRRASFQLN